MAILALFDKNQEAFADMSIEQIIALCGDGKLRDDSDSCSELRTYLKQIESEKLFKYISYCLESSFKDGGIVLQDLINEIGRRLDFKVTNGLYQGRKNENGLDGLWKREDGFSIIVEVKTTDAYRINLDRIADYRKKLIHANLTEEEKSSILIVVGRTDTGDLEAQVRGSKYAWDTRIISIDALIKLLRLKETTEEATTQKIGELLVPFENTRLDKFIDIAFTAAMDAADSDSSDVQVSNDSLATSENTSGIFKQDKTPTSIIDEVRKRIISQFSKNKNISLIRKTAALYWNEEKNTHIACTISKKYRNDEYWYAYHDSWKNFLDSVSHGYFALGCVDLKTAYILPKEKINELLAEGLLNATERDGKTYWHIHLFGNEGKMDLVSTKTGQRLNLEPYKIKI